MSTAANSFRTPTTLLIGLLGPLRLLLRKCTFVKDLTAAHLRRFAEA